MKPYPPNLFPPAFWAEFEKLCATIPPDSARDHLPYPPPLWRAFWNKWAAQLACTPAQFRTDFLQYRDQLQAENDQLRAERKAARH
jgi:hypothetical protein